jgi:hypothetical protein
MSVRYYWARSTQETIREISIEDSALAESVSSALSTNEDRKAEVLASTTLGYMDVNRNGVLEPSEMTSRFKQQLRTSGRSIEPLDFGDILEVMKKISNKQLF